jgi:glycogen debranching enzyme
MPGTTVDASVPNAESRNMPPELGPDAIAVVEGRTFMYSDLIGDVPPGTIGGLVNADTRLLSRWILTLNGKRLLALRSGVGEAFCGAFLLTNPEMPGIRPNQIGVRRLRLIGDGFRERIEVQSYSGEPIHIEVRMSVGNDFADLFEIKHRVRDRSAQVTRDHAADGTRLSFCYRNGDFEARTIVDAYPPAARIDEDDLVWDIDLKPHGSWRCELDVPLVFGPREITPPHRGFGSDVSTPANDPVVGWREQMPHLQSDSFMLDQVAKTLKQDLTALRIGVRVGDLQMALPAAGLPWFLTIFGRDTIITAYQTVSFGPLLAKGALVALASHQGTVCDDFRDEEPGKILHELRSGELTKLGLSPHNPYYGSIDSTPLWLILLSEYWRWSGDDTFVQNLRQNALAALNWIDEYGDMDDDGYLEYQTRSPQGLGNQCWRDSWDGVQFADGSLPVLPIATCETQGYVYDAKLRMAELAERPLSDHGLARELRGQAATLRNQFNRDFWIEERGGYYALGLDGDKRKIDSLTSNIGHLLWSGIVPDDRALIIAEQLTSEALFSGWGVRTLSTLDTGYNPIGYHAGTVWPHDNSLIVAGLARYGLHDHAKRIATAQFEAATYTNHRLPEAFSGYPRSYASFPVPYPTACIPQAWATGAPLLFMRSLLGLEPRDGEVTVDPHMSDEVGRIFIRDLNAFGSRWDIEAIGNKGHVRLAR